MERFREKDIAVEPIETPAGHVEAASYVVIG
jgi:hypothetical protein